MKTRESFFQISWEPWVILPLVRWPYYVTYSILSNLSWFCQRKHAIFGEEIHKWRGRVNLWTISLKRIIQFSFICAWLRVFVHLLSYRAHHIERWWWIMTTLAWIFLVLTILVIILTVPIFYNDWKKIQKKIRE